MATRAETFEVTLPTDKSVDEAVQALREALGARGFAVLWELDMQAKLREKGIEGGPEFRVLEVCSAPRAKEALDADIRVGYFLPCKMVAYRREGQTYIGLLKPTTLIGYFDDERLGALAREVEEVLVEALAAAREEG